MSEEQLPLPGQGIAAVERETGLSKDTLRVWERRYGFPRPTRDALGERVYPREQVERLRLLRRLVDLGYRPGKIIGLGVGQLQQLAVAASAAAEPGGGVGDAPELRAYLDLIRAHRVEELRGALSQAAVRLGLERFVMDVVAPLNRLVGDSWASGEVAIFEEHLYTESMQVVLRSAIGGIPAASGRPRILLTTLPREAHGLGLLMAEALMALEGARCASLGVQTPLEEIVKAAAAQQADILGLSFSPCQNPNRVLADLLEVRASLPPAVEIWAGGSCPILMRRPPAGVVVMPELSAIPSGLASWRRRHGDDAADQRSTNSVSTPV